MFGVKYRFVFILLLAGYSYLNILVTVGNNLFDTPVGDVELFSALFLVVLFQWEVNRLIETRLTIFLYSRSFQIHPLIIFFLISMAVVVVNAAIVLIVLHYAFPGSLAISFNHLKLLSAFGFRVNLFLHCINAIVFYMNKLKKTQLEAEEFKKISAEAQFEALRNQINPHFLFNSFNVLSSLVYKDADTASQFISQLSNVYRYLLFTQEKKVVSLQEENDFIESYLFLLKIRFGENLVVENQIVPDSGKFLAPATLQMLIENAIKHNVISRKKPLRIRLTNSPSAVTIANNLQEKDVKEPSSQTGLKNIQRRYGFLSEEGLTITKTETEFSVVVPLIEMEEI